MMNCKVATTTQERNSGDIIAVRKYQLNANQKGTSMFGIILKSMENCHTCSFDSHYFLMNTVDWGREHKPVTSTNKELNQQGKTAYTKTPQSIKEITMKMWWLEMTWRSWIENDDSPFFIIADLEERNWRHFWPYLLQWTVKSIDQRSCGWKWIWERNSLRYRYTALQCAASTLPLSFSTVPFQRDSQQHLLYLELILCSEWWEVSSFSATSVTIHYSISNFLRCCLVVFHIFYDFKIDSGMLTVLGHI